MAAKSQIQIRPTDDGFRFNIDGIEFDLTVDQAKALREPLRQALPVPRKLRAAVRKAWAGIKANDMQPVDSTGRKIIAFEHGVFGDSFVHVRIGDKAMQVEVDGFIQDLPNGEQAAAKEFLDRLAAEK